VLSPDNLREPGINNGMQFPVYCVLRGTAGLRCRQLWVHKREMFGDTCRFLHEDTQDLVAADSEPTAVLSPMSSTVGVGIEVNATGFDPASNLVTWNATYGKFLSWGPVNYTVNERGNPVTNHGEKLFWSFIEKPASTLNPVIITVTATDPITARVLGSSTVTLGWDGDFAVVVKEIR